MSKWLILLIVLGVLVLLAIVWFKSSKIPWIGIGDTIEISTRGRSMPAEIVKTPFV